MSTNNKSSSGNNNCHDKYTTTARDLSQANATIIAVALILLTIATSSDRPLTLLDVLSLVDSCWRDSRAKSMGSEWQDI
jgi:hypothetical protein